MHCLETIKRVNKAAEARSKAKKPCEPKFTSLGQARREAKLIESINILKKALLEK